MDVFEAPRPLSQVIEKTKEEINAEMSLLKTIAPQKTKLPVDDYPKPFAEQAVVIENKFNMDMTREERLSKVSYKSKTYINASYIKTPFREEKGLIIATSGPNDADKAFWTMVLQNNVTQILAVCCSDEAGYYFPKVEDSIMCGSIEVKLLNKEKKTGHVVRTLDVDGVRITHH